MNAFCSMFGQILKLIPRTEFERAASARVMDSYSAPRSRMILGEKGAATGMLWTLIYGFIRSAR